MPKRRLSLTSLILAALAAGAVFGAAAPTPAVTLGGCRGSSSDCSQMLVAPLVFSTLAAGIAGGAKAGWPRRLVIGAVVHFAGATLLAAAIALVAGNLLLPFVPVSPPHSQGAVPGVGGCCTGRPPA